MQIKVGSPLMDAFRPRTHALALEPRILFDGAAASAADQQHHTDPAHPTAAVAAPTEAAPRPASTPEPPPATQQLPTPPAAPAPHPLVVVDSRIENREQLTAQLPADAQLLVIDTATDGLAAISAALARMGQVDSIQIFSHGASGQFTLGSRTLSSDNIGAAADLLAGWRAELQPGADIQIYGCNVGAGPAGQALVGELARLTGADVGASSDNTGGSAVGGNWTLEVRSGDIDKPIALSAAALAGYDSLLLDAEPTVTLAGGGDVLLGGDFSFTVTFTNPSTQIGYAPYVDLFFPATGRDSDDGATFVSASYLGHGLTTYVVTFDSAGNATHPLWRDTNGNPVVVTAASVGMQPGDQMVVVVLPFGSVSADQPAISIDVTGHLSELADTSFSDDNPDLGITARGGFQFGNDSLNNPTNDPALVGSLTAPVTVHPSILTLTRSVDTVEGETVTGPNFPHTLTVTATPAPGQTMDNVVITQPVSPDVVVTGITPGAGGTITSITLADAAGTVVTDPATIAAELAAGTYLRDFTVSYPTVTAATATRVSFYVADHDATGESVIDPDTGNAVNVTFGGATAQGEWEPLDDRDVVPPDTHIAFVSNGADTTFIARSLSLHKESSVLANTGSPGLSPGDTLNYRLELAISDYFAFGQDFFLDGFFRVTDRLGDGQSFTGTPMLTFTHAGVTQTVPVVYTTTVNADGTTTLVFDIVATIQANSPLTRALAGDLADNRTLDGPATAVLTYQAVVNQSYTPPNGAPHSEINEGDPVGNNAEVSATLLNNLLTSTGVVQRDTSSALGTVPTNTVDIALVEVNGGSPPADGELRPGDLVTFRLTYDLVTSDYEQFSLVAYLPPPLLSTAGITWTQGDGAGQWNLAGGNSNTGPVVGVTSGPGNSVIFNFGDFAIDAASGSRIQLEFTLQVGDQPFADQRSLAVLTQSHQQTSLTHSPLVSSDIAIITSVAEPVLDIRHGVVSTTHGTVTGAIGLWAPPGSTEAAFAGLITDLSAVDGRVDGIDAADVVRMATAIENTGGGGAYDVETRITLPAGMSFVGGSLADANLQIRRGNGELLEPGLDYRVDGDTITFLDRGGVASLLPGRPGTPADMVGANIVVITYDTIVAGTIDASRTLQSTGTLSHYASVSGGPDFTPDDLTDTADQQVDAPSVSKFFAGGTLDNDDSSAAHTTGSDLVVGESMFYDIVVTLPEGTTQSLNLDDLIPAGLRLDTTYNNGLGYEIITDAENSALASEFQGTVMASGPLAGISGPLGGDGVGARLSFVTATADGDNDTTNNSFVVRVRLVASNTLPNREGAALPNDARILYTDPDGVVPNGSTAVQVTVTLTGDRPTVTVREPVLQITQSAQTAEIDPNFGVDEGDTVTYTVTITNSGGIDAFDISFLDTISNDLTGLSLLGVTYANGATNHDGTTGGFTLSGNQIVSDANADIDIPVGGSVTVTFSGVVTASAASQVAIANAARVQWTSLDGTDSTRPDPEGERTGADGVPGAGILNDYRRVSTLLVPVAQAMRISRVGGLPETPAPDPTNALSEDVTIGEIIRFRVVVLVPEGFNPDYEVRVFLPAGLAFVNPAELANNVNIALVSDGGLTSGTPDLATGALSVMGNHSGPIALFIAPDLSGDSPVAVLNPSRIKIDLPGDGSQVVRFRLGDLTNADSDTDLEGVIIDFNVRVANQAVTQAPSSLPVSAGEYVNTAPRATSPTVFERIVEPDFTSVDKRVTAFDPNPAGTTGTATVQVSFTQNGGSPAFDVHLADAMPGGSGYTLVGVTIDGVTYAPGSLPAGVSVSTIGGITADFAQLDPGQRVQLVYSLTLPNTGAIANTNATLTWTSLPDSFEEWGGNTVGASGAVDGERNGSEVGPNDYVRREGAGLGVITGTLWNDTFSPTASSLPDGDPLPGQTITLTWAGLDNNIDTAGDNVVFTTVTDTNGRYQFALLPSGRYRIDAPGTATFDQPVGELRVRIDTDSSRPLGQIDVNLGEGSTAPANVGYVEQNDPPVNSLPGPAEGLEDVALPIPGISISDIDANRNPMEAGRLMQVTLTVAHGTLYLSGMQPGVTVTGANTSQLVLSGSLANVNAALNLLTYLGRQDFNGTDTLTVQTSDRGNYGDFNGNGLPGELGDARTDTDSLVITLEPVNDAPVANDDTAEAVEAGGTFNQDAGVDPHGGLLGNDTDVDIGTTPGGDSLRVTFIGPAGDATQPVPSSGIVVATGQYGRLEVDSAGLFHYFVDNLNPAVEALRTRNQTLTDSFDYVIEDEGGLTDSARLTVTIRGANDAPVGADDVGRAVEAGGIANGTPGEDATGNVLPNDTDVDSVANGETRQVTGIRFVPQGVPGPVASVLPGTDSNSGTLIFGTYGVLRIGADGSYRYTVNNNDPTVDRLAVGDTLTETFSYRLTDTAGLNDVADLVITIEGRNDNPVASDDLGQATAGSNDGQDLPVPATGNVITVASRPGTPEQPGGNGIDLDVDRTDNPNTVLVVDGIRTGTEAAGGALGAVAAGGTTLDGLYGSLTINPDGSYVYQVDSSHPAVIALPAGATLDDVFTYRIIDTQGAPDTAQLTVRVSGVNDTAITGLVGAHAIEAGGIANTTPGQDPTGNVFAVVHDPDGDVLTVISVQDPVSGQTIAVVPGTPTRVATDFGTLTISADGSFEYTVNNIDPTVESLRTDDDHLLDHFTFTVADPGGKSVSAIVEVTIHGRNDNPVAVDDATLAVEAGGTFNDVPGIDPAGNLLTNDTDVDAGDTKTLTGIRTGAEAAGGAFLTVGAGDQSIQGQYGTLTVRRDGSFSYVLNNTLDVVQALRPGDTLADVFSYVMADTDGAPDIAQFTVTIDGAWDAPVATNDVAFAVANVTRNAPPVNPTRNVLPNDTDVDRPDTLRVSGIRAGEEAAGGALATVSPGSTNTSGGTSIYGIYGTLVIGSNGVFTYFVDTTNPLVVALGPFDIVHDYFTYQATDLGGLNDLAQIHIFVRGANEPPHANADVSDAVEAGGLHNAVPGVDPQGNVLANDTDVEGDALVVTQVRTGTLAGSGAAGVVGSPLRGQYGTLTLHADGSYDYVVDNDLPAVEALRISGQSLADVFTYSIEDIYGAPSSAELRVTIDGRNDTPIAQDDATVSIEAGGIFNRTPGVNPSGNVLDNDTDVDGIANGETRQVVFVTNQAGQSTAAGQVIAGLYGQLTIHADGSYTYVLDNANPAVEALRTPDETLNESFTYRMRDTAGATSDARLAVLIRGANDNPVAADDSNVAPSDLPAPQATGNVLPNDSDVDGGETRQVVAVRTGPESGSGTPGTIGQPIAGRYGTLVLHSDGSYTYTIDQTNPEVLAAAGLGRVLTDPFTYTVADRAGATDTAQLVITLDIAAPYIPPPGPYFGTLDAERHTDQPLPNIRPMVFITPVVREAHGELTLSAWGADGSEFWWQLPAEIQSTSLGEGLGDVPGQYVTRAVAISRDESQLDLAWINGRQGRIGLSADGLLGDPSLFTVDPSNMTVTPPQAEPPAAQPTAQGFSEQLRDAALRLNPLGTALAANGTPTFL